MSLVDIGHLDVIGTGYDGGPYACFLETLHEFMSSRDVIIRHVALESVQLRHNFLLFPGHAVKIFSEYLLQRLSLDGTPEIFQTKIFHSHLVPEQGVLRFCVGNHAVEIE